RSTSILFGMFAIGCKLDGRTTPKKMLLVVLFLIVGVWLIFGDRSLLVDLQRFLPAMTLSEPGLYSLFSHNSLPVALKAELALSAAAFLFFFLQKIFRADSKVPFRYLLPGLLVFVPWGTE